MLTNNAHTDHPAGIIQAEEGYLKNLDLDGTLDIASGGKLESKIGADLFTRFDSFGISMGEQMITGNEQVSVLNTIGWGPSYLAGFKKGNPTHSFDDHYLSLNTDIAQINAKKTVIESDINVGGYIRNETTTGTIDNNTLRVDSSHVEISPTSKFYLATIDANGITPKTGDEIYLFNRGPANIDITRNGNITGTNLGTMSGYDTIAFFKFDGSKWMLLNSDVSFNN